MLRYALRALHIGLGAGSLLLLYLTLTPFFEVRDVPVVEVPEVETLPIQKVAFEPYQIIGQRNLFKSRARPEELQAGASEALEEELEESRLSEQLRLVGTIAGDPNNSIATLEDRKSREHLHLMVHDPVGEMDGVLVARIERKRLVIDNKGKLEALSMDDEDGSSAKPAARPRAKSANPRNNRRGRPAARNRRKRGEPREDLMNRIRRLNEQAQGADNPMQQAAEDFAAQASPSVANLLQQVQVAPSFSDDGSLEGIKITDVVPDTPLAAAGLSAGDVITSVNGVPITGPGDLPRLPELISGGGPETCLEKIGPDGEVATHCWEN